jgi:hypothetical protein
VRITRSWSSEEAGVRESVVARKQTRRPSSRTSSRRRGYRNFAPELAANPDGLNWIPSGLPVIQEQSA